MTDAPSTAKSLAELTVGIPNAGRRTLLAALAELAEARFPDNLRLCVLDAERMDAPAQIALLDELAAERGAEPIFVLNKADRVTGPRTAVARMLALLRERGFSRPVLYPTCAAAARLLALSVLELSPEERRAQGDFYYRFAPAENSLSAFAVTGEPTLPLGSREVTPGQLALARANTGVPALAAALAARSLPAPEAPPAPEPAAPAADEAAPADETPPADEPAPAAEAVPAEPESALPPAPPQVEELPAGMQQAEDELQNETPEQLCDACESGDRGPEDGQEADEAAEALPERPPETPEAGDQIPEAPDGGPAPVEGPADPEGAAPQAEEAPAAEPAPAEQPEEPAEPRAPLEDEDLLSDIPSAAGGSAAPGGKKRTEAEERIIALMAGAKGADCATLLDLARTVKNDTAAPEELRERALDRLHADYLAREAEELELLTLHAQELDLPSLRSLADRITAGPYTVQNRAPYLASLNARIDVLQAEELEELCADVEEADARTLARIRNELERVDCAELLKTEHFRRIEARQEALDVEALERVTAGAEHMGEKELRAIAVTLEAGNWNPKYVGLYRHKIELCREAALYREVNERLDELDDMERRELLELREEIGSAGLPGRFTVTALRRIDEKVFRLDMLRFMALCSDFNDLDFEGIDELRAQAARLDACERARTHYLNYLLAREKALIVENCSARAEMTRQLIARHKLRVDDFCFPGASDYESRLAEFWNGTGLEQPRDLPVFLFDNASQFAISGSRFYFKVGRHLDCVPVENVERVQVMRQHLSLMLQIVGKDDSYRLTEARISRMGAERTLEFLNDCIKNWADPGPAGPLPANLRVRRLEPAEYTAPVEEEALSPRIAWELFIQAYEAAGLREGVLIREEESSLQRLPKLRQSLGLPENAPVVWYLSASRLGPVKEGVAVGSRGIYSKESKSPLQLLSAEEISAIRPAGSRRMTVSLLNGESVTLPVSDNMAPLIADYIRTLQLGSWLRSLEQ